MRRDLVDRERLCPRCCELDRKRNAVEITADARDRRDRSRGRGEAARCRGSVEKEADRAYRRDFAGIRGSRRYLERLDRVLDPACDANGLAAGCEDAERRRTQQQRLDQLGAGRQEVLAVVEDEQELGRAQVVAQNVEQR